MKSTRNKTIDISLEDGKEYLDLCLKINGDITLKEVLDKIIIGDTFTVMDFLPKNSVDLLIVDPPYNLSKNYKKDKL